MIGAASPAPPAPKGVVRIADEVMYRSKAPAGSGVEVSGGMSSVLPEGFGDEATPGHSSASVVKPAAHWGYAFARATASANRFGMSWRSEPFLM